MLPYLFCLSLDKHHRHSDLRYVRHPSADVCGAFPLSQEPVGQQDPTLAHNTCRAKCDARGDGCVAFRLRALAPDKGSGSTCLLYGTLSVVPTPRLPSDPTPVCHIKSSAAITHCPSRPGAAAMAALAPRARCPNATRARLSLADSPSGPKAVPLFSNGCA